MGGARVTGVLGLSVAAVVGIGVAQPANAQNMACNMRCAEEILSKPKSFAASLLVSEAMMARSVTKYCKGTRIVPARKPTYDVFIGGARKVFGFFGAGKMQRHADKRARESIALYGGCAGLKKVFNAKFAEWLLGWR